MIYYWAYFRFILIASLLPCIFITGCATNSQPKKVVSLNLVAAADLNPDINDRASPVAINIYQLASSSSFKKGDYMSVAENSRSAMGNDLLMANTVMIQPGQSLTIEYPIANGETAFGIVANYRVIDNSGWQLIYEYPREESSFWRIFAGKKISAHRILVTKNRIQFESKP